MSIKTEILKAINTCDLEKLKIELEIIRGNEEMQKLIFGSATAAGRFDILVFMEKEFGIDTEAQNRIFRYSAEYGHLEILKSFIEKKEVLDQPEYQSIIDDLVLEACFHDQMEILKFLHQKGGNLGAENNSSLEYACMRGFLEIVVYLIRNGVKFGITDNFAFELAASHGHLEIVKFLLSNGATITDEAVRMASKWGKMDVVGYFVSRGAKTNLLILEHQNHFRLLRVIRRWRKVIFLRRLFETAIPLYYSPGFPGFLKGKNSLEKFVNSGL